MFITVLYKSYNGGFRCSVIEHSSHRTLSIEQAPRIHSQLGMELMSISPICLRSGASPLGLWRAQTNSHLPALHHGLPPHTSTHVHSASLVWSVTLRIPYFQNSPSLRLPPSLSFFLSFFLSFSLHLFLPLPFPPPYPLLPLCSIPLFFSFLLLALRILYLAPFLALFSEHP